VAPDSEGVGVDVDDRLLIGEGLSRAARPPTETVTDWEG
jgi:hypothetical protein